ncbi:hypothetical protein V6N13_114666 [Hibiscus sabdariffa]|uniref:Uncharacterized protein n=1 Tax=Hibiscus sabdariffa TaxID=183260 RepID=A0ABR2U2W6_9ROSI
MAKHGTVEVSKAAARNAKYDEAVFGDRKQRDGQELDNGAKGKGRGPWSMLQVIALRLSQPLLQQPKLMLAG